MVDVAQNLLYSISNMQQRPLVSERASESEILEWQLAIDLILTLRITLTHANETCQRV